VAVSRRSTRMPAAMLAAAARMRRSPAEQGRLAGVEGGDRGVPVDGGYRGATRWLRA
jgi:hypothetical protein